MPNLNEHTFDVKLWAVARVRAGSEERARAILKEFSDCLDIALVADVQNRPDIFCAGESIRFTEASAEGRADLVEVEPVNGSEEVS